jgi:hypothetical protein
MLITAVSFSFSTVSDAVGLLGNYYNSNKLARDGVTIMKSLVLDGRSVKTSPIVPHAP